jgi:membrane protease YdiL (CAAX protease family)
VVAAVLWFFVARTRRLLPPQRHRAVPWGGMEILAAFFLSSLVVPVFVDQALVSSRFYQHIYGPDFPLDARMTDKDADRRLAVVRRDLWIAAVSFPFELGAIVLVLRARSDTRLYQLGLTRHRLAENVVAGYVFWLVLALPVYGLDWLVEFGYKDVLHVPPTRHPLDLLLKHLAGTAEWGLVALVVTAAAPVLEEILFRGLVQGWLTRRPAGGNVVMVTALALAVLAYAEKLARAKEAATGADTAGDTLERLAPVVFVLVLLPGYVFAERLAWRWLPEPDVARAIYAASVLFAIFHASVWPSPIPLFFLALGLGFLAYRTQSLVGPIICHALFNGIGALSELFTPR